MSASFLFVAGGTGGHVLPALAVAEELRALDPAARIHFVGGRRGIETTLVPAHGFALTRLPAAGMRGLGPVGVLRFVLHFALGTALALFVIARQRPAVALATGGYASAAPAVACALLRRPLWLQEQNAIPGSTNRALARFCERIFVAFESARDVFGGKGELLPNPVRRAIRESATRDAGDEDYRAFGLNSDRFTVLLFGGSRGARRLNAAFAEAWPRLRRRTDWQFLVQTGAEDFESTRAVVEDPEDDAPRVRVLPFIEDMAAAWRVADVVVCRAGAMTLAELAVVGRPAILVPYPHATDDHQRRNAEELAQAKAATLVLDPDLDGPRLARELGALFDDADLRARMAAAARAWGGREDGARRLAEELWRRAGGGER